MNNLKLNTLVILAMIFLTACDGGDDDMPCDTDEDTKSLMLEFNMNAGDSSFEYGTAYDLGGTMVEFSELRFYISDIMLHDDDGNTEMMDEVLLLEAGTSDNEFNIGNTSYTHIHEFHMLLGLNETVNHADPINAEAPLNDAAMHWGWNPDAGYKFIKAEFSVDTDGDNVPDSSASIHCATDALKREIMLDAHQDVDGDHTHVHIDVDVLSFFSNVDFTDLNGTHGDSDLTNLVADNAAGAFEVE